MPADILPQLGHGRPYVAIPGPSVIPDRVLNAMHRAAPNIYEGALPALMPDLLRDLRAAACTAQHVAIYVSNGHGAWEAALANTCAPGDRVLSLATGRFGHGWADMARGLGLAVTQHDFGRRAPVDPQMVEDTLRADTGHRIRAVLATHVDTASTVRNDVAAIRAAMDAAGHPALLLVDAIAALGCDPLRMDDWGVDVTVAASQKGLMTPPGLGLVWISDKALAASRKLTQRSPYWTWDHRINAEFFYQYFGGTAPTHHLYGLRAALDMLIHEEGLEPAWTRHRRLAQAVWAAAEAWGAGGAMALNIADPAQRSHAVTALRLNPPDASRLRAWTETQAGVTLGIGLGMADPGDPAWHGFFRIAHMGHVNAHMVLGALGAIDAGLKALSIPHGNGALDAATTALLTP
ncbi:MAG: alanine--glyoxylate aminotransferase family protein [Rhodobacteraceae bacterium]|nr:alanine--glyoxylate aminotransferase family protein [Paracoccaceae bacterium]